jgi:hypothetical protein
MSRGDCNADIVKYIVVQPEPPAFSGQTVQGDLLVTGDIINCDTGSTNTIITDKVNPCTSGVTISDIVTFYPNPRVEPVLDDSVQLGTPIRRWREVNTVSGTSTVWTSTNKVITPNLDLGLDSQSNSRIITADNSIIQDDCLDAGDY